jgi:hypothetical protein
MRDQGHAKRFRQSKRSSNHIQNNQSRFTRDDIVCNQSRQNHRHNHHQRVNRGPNSKVHLVQICKEKKTFEKNNITNLIPNKYKRKTQSEQTNGSAVKKELVFVKSKKEASLCKPNCEIWNERDIADERGKLCEKEPEHARARGVGGKHKQRWLLSQQTKRAKQSDKTQIMHLKKRSKKEEEEE